MNKIHEKRLKRKKKLKGRIKCHGNTSSCKLEHPENFKKPIEKIVTKKIKWYSRLLQWIIGYISKFKK